MKKTRQIQTILLILVFFTSIASAQTSDFRFRQISPPGGFTLDGIRDIIRDELGYMWMGTSQGLIKYDSRNVKWFESSLSDSLSLPSEIINNVYCDVNNQIWISTDKGLCKFIREFQKFDRIKYAYEDGSKSSTRVVAMLKTEDEKILIIDDSFFGTLDLENKQMNRIGKNQINSPTKLYKDNNNRIWIGTMAGDVFLFLPSENEVQRVISHSSSNAKINSIYSENEQIWIGTEGEGAQLYNLTGELLKQIVLSGASPASFRGNVRVIKKDTYGRLWYGTYEGLFMDDGSKITRFNPDDYPGLPHNSIYEIFEDEHGGLWFGTWSGGVALIHHSDNNFQTYRHSLTHNSISHSKATSFVQLNKDELLIGTEVGGLNSFNLKTEKFDLIQLTEGEQIRNIKSLCKDRRGGIWVGTFRKGLFYRPADSKKFKQFTKGPDDGKHISSTSVYSLCAVDSGVWIGTLSQGVNFYSFESESLRHCFQDKESEIPMANLSVNSILADSKSNLWLGASSGVLYKVQLKSNTISQFSMKESIGQKDSNIPPSQLATNSIFHLWQHSSGSIWCGTNNNGILVFHPDSSNFKAFDDGGILADKNVYGIIEDQYHRVWITSNIGLISYNQETKTTCHFDYSDGIQSNLFCPNAVYKDDQKNLYFGGTNGFTKIKPASVKLNLREPFTIINKLATKNNKSVYPIYSKNFEVAPIVLNPEETTFRINFSADNYLMPEKNKYKYRLINFYDEWINGENEGTVLFSSLDAGEYVFEVKSCNNDGIWNDSPTRMLILIKNHWYRTTSAYILYLISFSTMLYFIGRSYFERIKLKRAVLREKTQRENEEQIHEMKLKFFTNISHEFRTPLTLISWPLKRLSNADNITDEQREELEVANRNSTRLLQLTNQIIDLRKLEKEKSKLNISQIDIVNFIDELRKDFSIESKSREISFSFNSTFNSLEIEADAEKVDTIIYNLLSNAYKFTPDKGTIRITVDKKITKAIQSYSNQVSLGELHVEDFVEIAIEDNGAGIDNEDLVKIFTRFEQGKQSKIKNYDQKRGGGIGLAMCKDFVLLHHGRILVQSDLGKGSRFTVLLPLKQKAHKVLFQSHQKIKNLTPFENITVQPISDKNIEKSSKILLVEDNPDLKKLITCFLSKYYKIQSSSNGNEALQTLKTKDIDLIVSDVMMPGMDGFELCSIIKTQMETSHIPVILLTALSSSENLIAGLDKGADAYLTKPFDEIVLLKQIENILLQRKRIKENFSKQFISQKTIEVSSIDNFFLTRVQKAVEKNISEEDFNMDALADELIISRSQLHRKIKSLSGLTTSDFVNMIRIKKAVELLSSEKQYRFSEVAYLVGFSSQSYFNRCFKKVYDTTPKEYFKDFKNR